MFNKTGGYKKAVEDFYSLGVNNVREISSGTLIGQLDDGIYVNLHKSHYDELKRWTLERGSVKIRYID